MIFKTKTFFTPLLLPLVLLIAGLYLMPISIFQKDFSKIPGDFGDARFNNYILEHGYKYVTGKTDKYWNAPFMYPFQNVIAFSDNLLGTVPIYSAFRLLGNDRETSFQFWLLTLFVLNFICCYWVLNKWSGNSILSVTGAYIFAFSIFNLGHIYNVQSSPRFIVPLVFYWTWKYLSQKDLKYFLFTMLGIVFQFYCGIYLGFFLIYALLFLFIAYIIVYRDYSLFTQFKAIKKTLFHVIIMLIFSILLAPLMLPYLEISRKFGMRQFGDVVSTIPTLRSYFFTSKAPIIWQCLSEHGIKVLPQWWCHHLFMGIMPWIGIIFVPVVLFSRKVDLGIKKFIAFLSLGLFLTFIFCLNINGFTLYKIIFELPGFSSMRSINRVINTEVLFFILLFVFIFNELSKTSRIIKWIVISFPLLIIMDNLINPNEVKRFDKQVSQKEIENVKDKIKNQYDKKYTAIAYMPDKVGIDGIETHLSVMLAAQELNIPCVNAYTGSYPNEYLNYFDKMNDTALSKWLTFNHYDKNKIQNISDFDRKVESRKLVQLKAFNNKFICSDATLNHIVIANRDIASTWETFSLILFENKECVIRAYDGHFLSSEPNQQNKITAKSETVNALETFTIVEFDNNFVAFKACNGKYLSLDETSQQIFANGNSIGLKEKFKLID